MADGNSFSKSSKLGSVLSPSKLGMDNSSVIEHNGNKLKEMKEELDDLLSELHDNER